MCYEFTAKPGDVPCDEHRYSIPLPTILASTSCETGKTRTTQILDSPIPVEINLTDALASSLDLIVAVSGLKLNP